MRKLHTGFTLIELILVLIIAGIVLSLAVPSFSETLRNNRLTAQSNDLVTAINLARAEAVKRRANVTICPSTDQSSCTGSAWQNGWIVLADADDEVIMSFPPMKGATTVSANAALLRFTQRGFLDNGVAVSLTLCAGSGKPGRAIAVTGTGRPATISPHPTC